MPGEILGSHCLIYSHSSSDITSLLLIFHIVNIPSKQSHYRFLFPLCVIDHLAQRIVIVFRNTCSFYHLCAFRASSPNVSDKHLQ